MKSNDLKYTILDDGTAKITGYRGNVSILTIPDTIDGYAVTKIGEWAFSYCLRLENVIIPNSVTIINKGAFSNCKILKSVTIPDTVTTIENVRRVHS